jgi:hypothetical protein
MKEQECKNSRLFVTLPSGKNGHIQTHESAFGVVQNNKDGIFENKNYNQTSPTNPENIFAAQSFQSMP